MGIEIDNIQAVIDTAKQAVAPVTLVDLPNVKIVHTERGTETIDLAKHNGVPARKTGTVLVFDAASLSDLLAANAIPGATTLYINPDAERPAIVAVINGNGAAGPGHGDFKIGISFRETPQWKKWRAIDGKLLDQEAFAEFIEENLADIASPSGADLLEIVTYLQATRTVDFKSGVKLGSGAVQFQNLESVDAKVGAGEIEVPTEFTVALAPIFGVQPFAIVARFRFRIQDGRLKLGFKLQRIEDVMTQTIAGIEAAIVLPDGTTKVYGIAP